MRIDRRLTLGRYFQIKTSIRYQDFRTALSARALRREISQVAGLPEEEVLLDLEGYSPIDFPVYIDGRVVLSHEVSRLPQLQEISVLRVYTSDINRDRINQAAHQIFASSLSGNSTS